MCAVTCVWDCCSVVSFILFVCGYILCCMVGSSFGLGLLFVVAVCCIGVII